MKELPSRITDRLAKLGYPSPKERRDLYARTRARIGLPAEDCADVWLLYLEGAVASVVATGVPRDQLVSYASGPAFESPPPLVLALEIDGNLETLVTNGSSYSSAKAPPSWSRLSRTPLGHISSGQADAIVCSIASENRDWYKDERSQRMVDMLPRVFPEGTVALYELIQNAADCQASRAEFRVDGQSLVFLHDGTVFTENDVFAISFVNWSMKPPGTIGFMGIGFKAVYEVSDRPEIHSSPYSFLFDNTTSGGSLFPTPLPADHRPRVPDGYTTMFRLPLRDGAVQAVTDEIGRFDGKPLLYVGGRLWEITAGGNTFVVRRRKAEDGARRVTLETLPEGRKRQFIILCRQFVPSDEAVTEFAQSRRVEPELYQGRIDEVSVAVELKSGRANLDSRGHLQVYLPTAIELPLAFDLQGNFLITASRQELKSARGPWNSEHFAQLGTLLVDLLRHAKTLAASRSLDWRSLFDLIPVWSELPPQFGYLRPDQPSSDGRCSAGKVFADAIASEQVVPITDKDGGLAFVEPAEARCLTPEQESLFSLRDLASLTDVKPLWGDLTDRAKSVLKQYVPAFTDDILRRHLAVAGWENRVTVFDNGLETRVTRRQLARILAYAQDTRRYYLRHEWGYCRLLPITTGVLRASLGSQKEVFVLPDSQPDFPLDELIEQADIVSPGFLRDLGHPKDMKLDPDLAQNARRALAELVSELRPQDLAEKVVAPSFRDGAWQQRPDERLLRYTRFLLENSGRIPPSSIEIKLKLRSRERRYLAPQQLYFGAEYGTEGERMDSIAGSSPEIYLVSEDYLSLSRGRTSRDWVDFLSRLGVRKAPRLLMRTTHYSKHQFEAVRASVGNPTLAQATLRSTSIHDSAVGDWIPGDRYAVDDWELDPGIAARLRKMSLEKPAGWKDALLAFAYLLDRHWASFKEMVHKRVRFAVYYGTSVHSHFQPALSSFGTFLKTEHWLTALDRDDVFSPAGLVLPTEENKQLAGDATIIAAFNFSNADLIDFLGMRWTLPESTPLDRLNALVHRNSHDIGRFKSLYGEVSRDWTRSAELLRHFQAHPLIYVPDHEPAYLTADRLIFAGTTKLTSYFAAIGDTYSDLEGFFCGQLDIPREEGVEQCVCFMRDFLWTTRPSVSDELRSSIEYCYRRLLSYLVIPPPTAPDGTESELRASLGDKPMAYCGSARGWVNTAEVLVVYPDVTAYLTELQDRAGVAVESHIKRLERPVSDLEPLLGLLNLKPLSAVIDERPKLQGGTAIENEQELRDHLTALLNEVVELAGALAVSEEMPAARMESFMSYWRSLAAGLANIRFFSSAPVPVRVTIKGTAVVVHEGTRSAYLRDHSDGLDIYLAGRIPEVAYTLFEQLLSYLRIELLPPSLRDPIKSVLTGLLPVLDQEDFQALLRNFLLERGYAKRPASVVEEKLELASQKVTRDVTDGGGSKHGDPGKAGPSDSGRGSPRSESVSDPADRAAPPTPEDILCQLPEISEESFDDESFVEVHIDEVGLVDISPRRDTGAERDRRPHLSQEELAFRETTEKAHGQRGEAWVLEWERRKLTRLGRPDLASRVVHSAALDPESAWDIQSFEKEHPFAPMFIEAKSTSSEDDFTVEMSVQQVRSAMRQTTYLYRVLDVASARPRARVYKLSDFLASDKISLSAARVLVTLPRVQ